MNLKGCFAALLLIFLSALLPLAQNRLWAREPKAGDRISALRGAVVETLNPSEMHENPGDSAMAKVKFHIKKALALKWQDENSKALAELELALSFHKQSLSENAGKEQFEDLAYLAAVSEALAQNQKSKALYLELEKSSEHISARDYLRALQELTIYSVVTMDSLAAFESLANESYRESLRLGLAEDPLIAELLLADAKLKIEAKRNLQAIELLKKTILISGSLNPDIERRAEALLSKAYLKEQKNVEAEKISLNLLEQDRKTGFKGPYPGDYISTLAEIYLKSGRKNDADNLFQSLKAELQDRSPALWDSVLEAYAEASDTTSKKLNSADLNNQAYDYHQLAGASSRSINSMISFYYVLRTVGLFAESAKVAALEDRLRKLEDKNAPPANRDTFAPKADASEILSTEKKAEIIRRAYDVKFSLEEQRKILDRLHLKVKGSLLEAVTADFEQIESRLQ
ncbi:MAG: hypothetical protein K2X27_27805 [Candidatus Obscuribacterales bacterium]|nr:hypothetical protein [Candidatus Obscuribacterales bacterium]